MTNHPNRPRRAMRRESYLAAARKLEYYAQQLRANADRETPQQKRQLTLIVNNLPHLARKLCNRHHGRNCKWRLVDDE